MAHFLTSLKMSVLRSKFNSALSGFVCAVTVFTAVIGALCASAVPAAALDDPVIERARNVYLYNIENEQLLFEKDADQLIFPASMVKIMTAILAIEYLGDRWDETVKVPKEAVEAARGNSTKINLKADEEVTIGDLISSIIVGGANDSSCAAAILVSGSIEKFIMLMNQRAEELGAVNTHFTNCTGIHDDRMKTTLEDMALIALHAYHLTRFIDASSLERYVMGPTNLTKGYRYIVNRNYFVSNTVVYKYYNPEVVGMNAGSTSAAGNVVVAVAAREGVTQLVLVAGGESENIYGIDAETGLEKVVDTINHAYVEAQKLLDWSFDGYDYIDILSPAKIICEIPVKMSGKVDHVTLLPEVGITEYMPSDIDPNADIAFDWTLDRQYLTAPVERGQVAGRLKLYYNGTVLNEVNLVAQNTVDRDEWLYLFSTVLDFMKRPGFIAVVVIVILLFVCYVLLVAYLRERSRKKRMRNRSIVVRK